MLFDHRDMVEEFQGEYRFLSNFYPSEFEYTFIDNDKHTFKTVENFYQAMKFRYHDYDHYLKIINAKTPGKAKLLGKKGLSESEANKWETVKVSIMKIGIQNKFRIPELRERLIDTVDMYLQEGNNWGDDFWGFDFKTQKGKNVLGTLLMEERKRIINTQTDDQ